jgi:DNA-binding transcriptional regulator YdaS (Cro superfamily)
MARVGVSFTCFDIMLMRSYMNAIEKVVSILGSQTALAKKLNVAPQAVGQWVASGKPPAGRVLEIERLVEGEVTRYSLRPDYYPNVSD